MESRETLSMNRNALVSLLRFCDRLGWERCDALIAKYDTELKPPSNCMWIISTSIPVRTFGCSATLESAVHSPHTHRLRPNGERSRSAL